MENPIWRATQEVCGAELGSGVYSTSGLQGSRCNEPLIARFSGLWAKASNYCTPSPIQPKKPQP